jgi:hypothetical protein
MPAFQGLNLRFPKLFVFLATLTAADFLIPGWIPFVDELFLALLTLIVGLLRDRRTGTPAPPARPLPGVPSTSREAQ